MTDQPISSISYNTIPFLTDKLNELKRAHVIQSYQFIFHYGEDGDKDHIHFRIEPNRRIDPMDITELLKEPDSTREDGKMLGIRTWRKAKEEDWFLYAVHDKDYLKLKYSGGDPHEKIPYDWQDIVVDDGYNLETAWVRAKSSMKHNSANMALQIIQGRKPIDLILEGENVHTVNAINQSLKTNDYSRLQNAYNELELELNLIKKWCEIKELDYDYIIKSMSKRTS